MAKLTGQTIASSYDQLLIVTDSNGVTSTLQAVESADTGGAVSSLQISTVAAAIDNPTASSATQGGKLTLFSDDGAALGDTHRLGVLEFSAAEDTSSTITIGARIEAIADAAWSASENGADMVFYTTDGNASQSEVMRLTADNNVGIGCTPNANLEIKDTSNIVIVKITADNETPYGLVIGNDIASPTDTHGLQLWTMNDGTGKISARGSGDENLILQPSGGNVGIGTAAPTSKLHVKDSGSGARAIVSFYNGGESRYQFEQDSSENSILKIRDNAEADKVVLNTAGNSYFTGGNVGIGTTAPGQLLDVNSGGGNMIADGYDTHSLAVYKENIEDASGYLDKVLACPAQKWNRKPFVSADEIKEAVLEEFGEDVLIEEAVEAKEAVLDEDGNESEPAVEAKDAVYEKQYSVWDELFPEDNSHRQKALYNMPDGDLKTWIDDWCEAKRVEMRPENKWQKKRLGLVADAELTAEHLPEVVSINDEGEPTGIDTMTYIGILHNAIQELSAKVEALENA